MFVEKHLEESNDIPRLLSKEIKEIYMAELCTLDESIEELKENLKRKFQVGRVIAEYMEVHCVPNKRTAFAQNDDVSYLSSQSADEREKQSKLRKDIELLQVLRNTVSIKECAKNSF